MVKRFQHRPDSPYHISIGAVLVNEQGRILVHHYLKDRVPEALRSNLGGLDEAYILMRESLENDETLEEALARGLREEFGAEGSFVRYLGSVQCHLRTPGGDFEKTTLYSQVALTKIGERPADDAESFSELVWMEPNELLEAMRRQGQNTDRTDLDESKIIETYLRHGTV